MTQVVGSVSDENLWSVICDELHDEHPPERVRWLREELSQVTVGMVWRAAPRLRSLIEGQWPRWNVSPRVLPHIPPAQMVRMVLVDTPQERVDLWLRLPEGFRFPPYETRLRRHTTLGTVAVAVRGASEQGRWPQWHALYQDRWGLEEADFELVRHSYVNGVRFGEGGLEGLLEDLRVEVQRQQEVYDAAQRVMEAEAQRVVQRAHETWPGGVAQEQRYRTDDGEEGAWPMEGVLDEEWVQRVRNETWSQPQARAVLQGPPQQGWTHRGVAMDAVLRHLLGGEVGFERDVATMRSTVRWEGVSVTVMDTETVMSPGPEALALDIVRRLVLARQTRAVEGLGRGRFTDDVARVRTLTVWDGDRQQHSIDYHHIAGTAPGDDVQLTLWTNAGVVDVVVEAQQVGRYRVEYEGRTLRGTGVTVEWWEPQAGVWGPRVEHPVRSRWAQGQGPKRV